MKAALLTLAACSATPRPTPPPAADLPEVAPVAATAPVPEESAPPATHATMLAVAEVVLRVDECSGLGGEHYVLRLHDGTDRLIHAGGHGARLELIPFKSRNHAFVIAELDLEPALVGGGGGWCLDGLPGTVGQARRILPVASVERGRDLLRRILRSGGLPADPTQWPRVTRVIPTLDYEQPCKRAICR